MGIGTERGEGWGLDPALQGQPLPQVHMGKHLAALSLFHICLYLCLTIFPSFIPFFPFPTQGCCSHSCNIMLRVFKWVLRSLASLWSALAAPSEKLFDTAVLFLYETLCLDFWALVLCFPMNSRTRPATLIKHQLSLAAAVTLLYLLKKKRKLFYTGCKLQLWDFFFLCFWLPAETIFEANTPVFLLRTGPHKSPKIIAPFHFFM